MWFKRKAKFASLDQIAVRNEWSVGTGKSEGKPMIVRLNTGAVAIARHPELGHRLGVAIPLHQPDARGFPNNVETAVLADIEDRLCEALSGVGCMVVVVTWNGMREFVSYVCSVEAAKRVVEVVQRDTPSHEVQHYVADDPEWHTYGEFQM